MFGYSVWAMVWRYVVDPAPPSQHCQILFKFQS